jgi:hypothetical protein
MNLLSNTSKLSDDIDYINKTFANDNEAWQAALISLTEAEIRKKDERIKMLEKRIFEDAQIIQTLHNQMVTPLGNPPPYTGIYKELPPPPYDIGQNKGSSPQIVTNKISGLRKKIEEEKKALPLPVPNRKNSSSSKTGKK